MVLGITPNTKFVYSLKNLPMAGSFVITVCKRSRRWQVLCIFTKYRCVSQEDGESSQLDP